jgi:hypothetical protein
LYKTANTSIIQRVTGRLTRVFGGKAGSDMTKTKIRIVSFLVIFGVMVNSGLQANTISTAPSNINVNLAQPNYTPTIVGLTTTPTTTTPQNTNLCIMSFCGSTSTNVNITFPTITLPTTIGSSPTLVNSQPLLTTLPIGTTVIIPSSVVQPSNTSTVTTSIPTIQITTNFNFNNPFGPVGDFSNPEPSTVLLLVSGMAVLGILYRKRIRTGRV